MSTQLSDPTPTLDPTISLEEETMNAITEEIPADLWVRAITVEIRRAMKQARITQGELSKQAGIPLPTLARRLTDSGRPWLMSEVLAVAAALGTTAADLAERAEQLLGWVEDKMASQA